jgi:hypothetical protein
MGRAILSLVLLMHAGAAAAAKPARVNREAVPYTVRLPAVDRVELEAYEVAEMDIKSVKATKVLEGAEARAFAALWRRQDYKPGSAACHYPFVGVKFYSKGRLIAHASVCWMCDNIDFLTPRLRHRQSFVGGSRRGKELGAAFARAFKQ